MIFGFCLGGYRTSAKIQILIRKIGVLRSTLEAQAKIAPQQLMLGQRRFSGTPHLSIGGLASVFPHVQPQSKTCLSRYRGDGLSFVLRNIKRCI